MSIIGHIQWRVELDYGIDSIKSGVIGRFYEQGWVHLFKVPICILTLFNQGFLSL